MTGQDVSVVGASRGIGRASALALAKAGAQVLVHYSSSGKEAEAVVAEIRQAGGRAEKVAADLRTPNGPHALAKLVHGIVGPRLDILVANAGIAPSGSTAARNSETPARPASRKKPHIQLVSGE